MTQHLTVEEQLAAAAAQRGVPLVPPDPVKVEQQSYDRFLTIMQEPFNPDDDPDKTPDVWRGQPGFDVIVRQLKRKAMGGDLRAIQLVMEWRLGKAVQRSVTVEVKGDVKDWRELFNDHAPKIAAQMAEARAAEADRWKIEDIVDVDVQSGGSGQPA